MAKLYESVCYCTNLRRGANALSDYYDVALKDTGLTVAQYYLLVNLSRLQAANITHWSARVGLDRSTMVRNLKLLLDRGLIEQTEGHGKVFTLSSAGQRALDAAMPVWQAAQQRIRTFLGEADAEAVLRIGRRLQELSESV